MSTSNHSSDYVSPSTGIVLRCDGTAIQLGRIPNMPSQSIDVTAREIALINDWQAFSPERAEEAVNLTYAQRALDDIHDALLGLSDALLLDVLLDVEQVLALPVVRVTVFRSLATAPMSCLAQLTRLVHFAESRALPLTHNTLRELADLQPLIRRLCDAWRQIPHSAFAGFDQNAAWKEMVLQGLVLDILHCRSAQELQSLWLDRVLISRSPKERVAWNEVRVSLSGSLFPAATRRVRLQAEDDRNAILPQMSRARTPDLGSALRQVDAVAQAVADGRDLQARKFMRDLVEAQVASGGVQYAIKSLCNIAQRAAELFRTDFEHEALNWALDLDGDDSWLLVQWGDHLKRRRNFSEAQEAFEAAIRNGGGHVAESALADVFTSQGNYSAAEARYKAIRNWESIEVVRTALADLKRFRGRYDEALLDYQAVLAEWPGSYRSVAGRAEVRKNLGQFEEAVSDYASVLDGFALEQHDASIFRSGLAHVLLLKGELSSALRVLDTVLEASPFMNEARLRRAATIALMGDVSQGALAAAAVRADEHNQWQRDLLHAPMLIRLGRTREAAEMLYGLEDEANPRAAVLRDLVRVYLSVASKQHELHIVRAFELLHTVRNGNELYWRWIADALALHSALRANALERVSELEVALATSSLSDANLRAVEFALKRRDFGAALDAEFAVIVKLAA